MSRPSSWTRWNILRTHRPLPSPTTEKGQSGGKLTETWRGRCLEEKKAEAEKVSFPLNAIRKYFPRSYTPQRMQETIIKLLEQWQKKRQRGQER